MSFGSRSLVGPDSVAMVTAVRVELQPQSSLEPRCVEERKERREHREGPEERRGFTEVHHQDDTNTETGLYFHSVHTVHLNLVYNTR